jgi:hypothetical protein
MKLKGCIWKNEAQGRQRWNIKDVFGITKLRDGKDETSRMYLGKWSSFKVVWCSRGVLQANIWSAISKVIRSSPPIMFITEGMMEGCKGREREKERERENKRGEKRN